MKLKHLTFRENQRIKRNEMYADYLKSISLNPAINKAELRRRLAKDYGYTSENSINTIIWEIEKNNGQKSKRTNRNEN